MNEQAWQWAESLAHWLLAWTVVVGAIAAWLRFTKTRRPSIRYAGWLVGTFAGVALLPVALELSPVISWQEAVSHVGGEGMADADLLREMAFLFETGDDEAAVEASIPSPAADSRGAGQPRLSITTTMLVVWTIGAALLLLRLLRAAVQVRRLVGQANWPVPTNLLKQYEAIRREVGISRSVRLVVHPEIAGPMCTGIVRPTILWPRAAIDQMSVNQRAAAFVHELAHLRRYDDWVLLVAELWRAVCWFYLPLHWTIRCLRREQEFLCDDRAALALESANSYAQLLLDQAPLRAVAPVLCSSFVGGSTMSQRIRRILRGELGSVPVGRPQAAVLVTLSVMLLAGAGSLRLVGFVTRAVASEPVPTQVPAKEPEENGDESTRKNKAQEVSAADREAEAALEALSANIERDGDEVVYVSLQDSRQVTDADLVYLTKLPWRKTRAEVEFTIGYFHRPWPSPALNLAGTEITDAGVEHLKGLTNLRTLKLNGTEITDAGLVHLKGLTSLESLRLPGTEISDAGLEHLKALTSLEGLWLHDTEITDAGLVHLKGLTSLRGLVLSIVREISVGSLRRFG